MLNDYESIGVNETLIAKKSLNCDEFVGKIVNPAIPDCISYICTMISVEEKINMTSNRY